MNLTTDQSEQVLEAAKAKAKEIGVVIRPTIQEF